MCVPGSGSSRVVERASGACDRNVADPTTTHLTGEAEQWPSRSVGFLGCRFKRKGAKIYRGKTKLAVAELVNLTWVLGFTSF